MKKKCDCRNRYKQVCDICQGVKKKESTLTYCPGDYKNRHCWERIGITTERTYSHKYVYMYLRCTQCGKCKRERVKYVKGGK